MVAQVTPRETLSVPDRFENLRDAGSGALRSIIVPVEHALSAIDTRFEDLGAAGRGGLMILRGDSGSGKSTFLDTIGLFRTGATSLGDEALFGMCWASSATTARPSTFLTRNRDSGVSRARR